MLSLRPLFSAIRLTVACLILAIGLRTWLVMGWIEPVTVAGCSMVPTLQGGERLWIDRTARLWSQPQRWEVVVARNPTDATELCIKRIVALPGEHVSLRDGNVFVDGAVVVKSLDEQVALRQILDSKDHSDQRWRPALASGWRWNEQTWQYQDQHRDSIDWLRYQHPRSQPITDDVPYNTGLTRRLSLVNEFMLTAELSVQGTGWVRLAIDDGTSTAQVDLHWPGGQMTVIESKGHSSGLQLSARSRARLARGKVQIEFSNFDQQLLLAIDGHVELRRPWPKSKAAGTARPFSLGAQNLDLSIRELTLYRDTYHSGHAVGVSPRLPTSWQLGPREYFLLGDNAPLALDSRLWGPIPGRLLVGKPLLP